MLRVASWRRAQWLLFGLGLVSLSIYLGFLSTGGVEHQLDRLGAHSEQAAAVLGEETGRGAALVIVFAFLLLTPVAVILALAMPVFAAAATAALLHRLIRLPEATGSLLFWIALVAVGWLKLGVWLPWAQWVVSLVARAFFLALRPM